MLHVKESVVPSRVYHQKDSNSCNYIWRYVSQCTYLFYLKY